MHWPLCFALFVANAVHLQKSISSRESIDLFSSEFQNIIPNKNTPTYHEEGGVSHHQLFRRKHKY